MIRASFVAAIALLGGFRGNVARAADGVAAGVEAADPPGAAAQPGTPAWAEGADVVERLGARLPLDLTFVDANGQRVPLRSLFDGVHPVLLVLAYYECPQLCSLVLDAAVAAMHSLEQQGFQLGPQYRVATISFDATERIDQAARKQASVLSKLGHGTAAPWPFLIGDADSVRTLTQRLGFSFLRDPRTGAIAHAAVVFVLTPEGVISRYLYGIDYPPRDLKLALLEASQGKTGSFGDRVLMRCFEYDPATRRYGLFVSRFMKVGGLLIFLVVLAMLCGFIRYEHRRARSEGTP
ncbi:MAG TPA: SCO family protein [Kofleriaceae bacterium]|nr:SCO family protein [Kofleriaceae bacterium]